MLNLVKYKADPARNKSGEHLTEAQQVLEAGLHFSINMHYIFGSCMCQAYRQIADSDRKGFIAGYQKNGLKDLKWMGTKKVVKEDAEEDLSIKGMMTSTLRCYFSLVLLCFCFLMLCFSMPLRSRIFELNGLKMSDFPEKKQKDLLEGLLQESEDFWGHERNTAPSSLAALKKCVDDLRKIQVLLDRKIPTMDEAACKAEKADIDQWNRNANGHLDNVKLLLKKVRGWLA